MAGHKLNLTGAKFFCVVIRQDMRDFYNELREWSNAQRINGAKNYQVNLNALFNAMLPALAIAVRNFSYERDGKIYVRMDFGDILVTKPYKHEINS